MKRLVTFLMLFIAVNAFAQDIYWWEDGQWVGNLKTNVNKSFSNVVAAIALASGGAQSPYTNTHNAASASITNVPFILFNGTNDFAIGWGTNRLVFQGTTNVAYNGVSMMDISGTATAAASMASWKGTNLLPLAFGAGNTATVLRSDVLLKRPFRVDVTSTPASITFEAAWPTNEIADAFLSIQKGTNSLTLVGATIIDSGRASSTNVFPSSTNRTGVLFHKELGESKFYSIQMVP